jgi:hypothetical protein
MPKDRDCRCKDGHLPLSSFCQDDLYCSQCGGRVAWLESEPHGLPNPALEKAGESIFWIYAKRDASQETYFHLPLEYNSLNENRNNKDRDLILSEEQCEVEATNWPYKFELEFVGEASSDRGGRTRCTGVRLKLHRTFVEKLGDNWTRDHKLMPAEGIRCTLTLVGNCGEHTFALLACGEPRHVIEVRDKDGPLLQDRLPNIDELPDDLDHAWAIAKRGHRELEIRVQVESGFLCLQGGKSEALEQNPTLIRPKEDFVFSSASPEDCILGPGHPPCIISASFDSSRWVPGELQMIRAMFLVELLQCYDVWIPLYLEPRGDVAFRPSQEFRIPPMYYGEVAWSQSDDSEDTPGPNFAHIKVFNSGEETLKIRRPRVESQDLPDIDWIEVGWVARLGDPTPIEPNADHSLDLGVKIDLSRVTPALHKARTSLTATISLESDVEDLLPWDLPVVVQSVEERPELGTPLAIDFGNSNSYAAYMMGSRPVAVLGGGDPENFPTVLHFQEPPDASLSKVEIGRDALAEGERAPSSMVRWLLKRWLLDEPGEWKSPWPIRTSRGQAFTLSKGELIRIFLEKIILKSEKALRRTITRIGLSYPANFSPRARRRLDVIIAELEERLKASRPHLRHAIKIERIATRESSPDEASAVAIGFVHDNDRFEREVLPHLGPDRTFLVASYDFGGGSIDTALLRFTSMAGRIPYFESEHLSLGGDESFGGDNVTTAVFQLLLDRFRGSIRAAAPGAEFPIVDFNERQSIGTDRWTNHQNLRVLAEHLKRYLCRVHSPGAAEPPPVGSAGAGMASSQATGSTATGRLAAIAAPPALEPLEFAIVEFFNRIILRLPTAPPDGPAADPASLRVSFRESMLRLTLADVYNHQICYDVRLQLYYSVEERIRKSIGQLRGFVEDARLRSAGAFPLFIVLAGAACRLPLVGELLADEIKDVHVIDNPLGRPDARPKSKVAFGLGRYLDYLANAPYRMEKLSRAGHYTHGPIVWKGGGGDFVVWIPTCVLLTLDRWFVLEGVPLRICLRPGNTIDVYHEAFNLEKIGTFDLSRPATDGDPSHDRTLPEMIDMSEPSEVLLKVDGSEEKLLLKVRYGKDESGSWREYGDWELIPAEVEADGPRAPAR